MGASACDPFNAPEPAGFDVPASNGDPTTEEAGGAAQVEVDTDAVLASIADGGYRGAAFTHATRTPYASAVATGSFVDEWVSSASYAEYSKVQPDATGSGAQLPAGSMIVRAVIDADAGAVARLTVMLKGPAGYNPALGDWWFAETDPWGTPLTDDAGTLAGRLADCYGCHVPRGGDDFLFGVPLDDRPPD
jgi:hypothetical protein